MKALLITGGAGFIGSNFIHYLLKKNNSIHVLNLDDLTYAGNLENLAGLEQNKNYTFIRGNICNLDNCKRIFSEFQIDSVINFAAESHVDRSILGPRVFVETNVLGTQTLLECAKEFKIKRFLQVSTDEVYGSLGTKGSFTEDSHLKPNSPYSSSKAAADLLVRSYFKTHKIPCMITRCSNNYGPYQFPEKLIPLVIHNCQKQLPIPIYGKGKNIRDWIHVIDHARAIYRVLKDGKEGEIYNIGSNNEWENIDIVKLICSNIEKKLNFKKGKLENLITFVKDRPGHDQRYAIDSTKIRAKLKWKAEIPFHSGIQNTIDWYLTHQNWLINIVNKEYLSYYDKHYTNRDVTYTFS